MATSPSALPAAEHAQPTAEEELERRVQERTASLAIANEALRKEIAEGQRAGRTEKLFRLAVELASNGILMVGHDGVIVLTNAQLEKLFGYRKEELLGQPVEMLVPERCRARHAADRAAFFVSPTARFMGAGRELYGLRKDGTEVPVEIGLQPLQTEAGAFVLATIIDITERKRAEEERRDLLKEYRMMFDSVPALIWYKDRHNRILRVNAPAAASMGKSVADLEGKSTYDLYPDEAEKYHRDDLEVIHSGRPTLGIIEKVVTASGDKLWVQTDKVPYRNERGEILGVIVFSVNVTERQRAQEEVRKLNAELEQRVSERTAQLEAANILLQAEIAERKRAEAEVARRAEQLDESNKKIIEAERLKSAFFASVSHELRTPLTLILSPLESLLAGEHGALVESQRPLLETLHNNSVRLLQMVTGLLDFAKLEARRFEVKREPVEIAALTRAIVADFEPMMHQLGLECNLSTPASPAWVHMDRYLYERILFNLLSNALKFTPKGGRIGVVLRHTGERLHLSAADTGVGIAEEFLPNLFQRFRQLEGASTRRFEGTGLGLALVKEFADLLGGTVQVKSKLGEGSTFTLECPASPAAAPADETEARRRTTILKKYGPAAHAAAGDERAVDGRAKLLIAEDNMELAAYMASLLRDLCQTRIARDGEEALELVQQMSPDLVLSDVMMPRRDGLSLCRELKANPKTAAIPVVLLTAMTHREALLKGWEAGADEYLFKPFHPKELLTRIKAILTAVQDRRRGEEELRRTAAELARSNAELELFASVASHDLQEPLRMVSSYLELIAQRYRTKLDDKADRWIGFAVAGAARMKELINDLLEFSRVSTQARPFAPVDCAATFAAAEANLRSAIRESDAVVTHGPLPTVHVDATQFTQVWQNLLANAIKYRGPQRPEVRVEAVRQDGQWLFSVRDNGIGVDPQFRERIFVIFQRLHTQDEYAGTGIGLALCRKVIERHGGRIWVESQPGQGATFYFTLPDRKEDEHAAAHPRKAR